MSDFSIARWTWLERPLVRYSLAIIAAAAAQLARLPLDPPTLVPFITYVPFILISACLCGFGPGLLTTLLCVLENHYFALDPVGTFLHLRLSDVVGKTSLAFAGLVSSAIIDKVKRSQRDLDAHPKATECASRGIN